MATNKFRQKEKSVFDKPIEILQEIGVPILLHSTDMIPNLNADMLDGKHGNEYAPISHTHEISDVNGLQTALDNAGVTYLLVTETEDGLMDHLDKIKLNNIEDNANNYVHPLTHPAAIITTDVTNFNNILTNADTNTQLALITLSNHNHDSDYASIASLDNYFPITGGDLNGEINIGNGWRTKTLANQEIGIRWILIAELSQASGTGASDPMFISGFVNTGTGNNPINNSYSAMFNVSIDGTGTVLPSVTSIGNRDYTMEDTIPEFAIYYVDNDGNPSDYYLYYKIPAHCGKTSFMYMTNLYTSLFTTHITPTGVEYWSSIHDNAQDLYCGRYKVYNEYNFTPGQKDSVTTMTGTASELISSNSLVYVSTSNGTTTIELSKSSQNQIVNAIAIDSIANTAEGTVYSLGVLLPYDNVENGQLYYLDADTPGGISKYPIDAAGTNQIIGIGTENGIQTFWSQPAII